MYQCNLEFSGIQHTNTGAKVPVPKWDFSYNQVWILPSSRQQLSHCSRELHFNVISLLEISYSLRKLTYTMS